MVIQRATVRQSEPKTKLTLWRDHWVSLEDQLARTRYVVAGELGDRRVIGAEAATMLGAFQGFTFAPASTCGSGYGKATDPIGHQQAYLITRTRRRTLASLPPPPSCRQGMTAIMATGFLRGVYEACTINAST
ncbi:hypothetical protein AG1IA_05703 [Rhizoctonia solani AG-1 IA]|uniref:Uncharacterized protein n=1 Tax=Thanatephorus cucumeris (strain AG1-IA) TaxID=983506 RepID=L8WQ74_THACA|nr:hypothetical protein AG1IA_05703 [Rhizoctonia solani AG-1 IA]